MAELRGGGGQQFFVARHAHGGAVGVAGAAQALEHVPQGLSIWGLQAIRQAPTGAFGALTEQLNGRRVGFFYFVKRAFQNQHGF